MHKTNVTVEEAPNDGTETRRSFTVVVKCCCSGCSKKIIDDLVNKHDINKKKEESHCCCECEKRKKKKKKKKEHCCHSDDEDEEEEEENSKRGNETKRSGNYWNQQSTHKIEPYRPTRCDKRVCRDDFCPTHSIFYHNRSIIRPSLVENEVPMMPTPFIPTHYYPQPTQPKLPPSPLFFTRGYMNPPVHPSHTWAGSRRFW